MEAVSDLIERLLGALHDERAEAMRAGKMRRLQELHGVGAVVAQCAERTRGPAGELRDEAELILRILARGYGIDED